MRIHTLDIENFKALRGKHSFELPPGIIGIVGDNGQGKSTLTTAISWALYGPAVFDKKVTSADTIHWMEKEAQVGLNFSITGEDFELVRAQRAGGSHAQLRGPVNADGPDAVTKAIADVMGIDYVGFLASVFSRQKDLEGLATLSGPERTKTVLRLRGLDKITKAIDMVGDVARESKKELGVLRAALPDPRPVSEYDKDIQSHFTQVGSLEDDLGELTARQREITREVDRLVTKQKSLSSERQAFLNYLSAKAHAESRVTSATQALEKAQGLAALPLYEKPVPPSVTAKRDRFKSLSQKQAEDREYVRSLMSVLQTKDTCPTCMRKYDNAAELEEAKDKARAEKNKGEKRVYKRESELRLLEEAIKEEDRYENLMIQWQSFKDQWDERQEAVVASEKAVEQAERELGQITPVVDVTPIYDETTGSIRTLESESSTHRERHAQIIGQIDRLNDQIERVKVERAKAVDILTKVGGVEKRALESEVTVNQLRDFKTLQMGGLIPDISTKASDLLANLTEGKYSELILTPEWEIQYRYENGDVKGFHSLSVGERNTFALALRLALADLQASNIGLLVLDEVLDAMDDNRQNLTWGTLEGLLGRYEQILVITHVSAFKERAPFIIQL